MALVAKIAAKSGKSVRTFALRKGVNVLRADVDAVVTIIDDATGKSVDGAHLTRNGAEVSVSLPDSYFAAAGYGAAQDAAPAGGGAEAPAAPAATAESGGGNGIIYGVLGAAALGGLAAAAGGGGGGSKPPADTTAPSAPTGLALAAADDSGASNSDRITSQTSALTITGTAEANATVKIMEGSTQLGTATANSSGEFSIDIALAAGVHNITATATDAAGNLSAASTALAITVDTTAPAAPTGLVLAAADDMGVSNSDGVTSQTSALTISGAAEANASVTVRDGSTVLGTTTANGSGQFTLDVSLAAGTHSITATATDAAGNVGSASSALAITVDTTAPTVGISSSVATLLGSQTATLTFSFSEAPSGFTASDVTVTGGAISALTVSPTNPNIYTATLTPTASVAGNLAISIANGSFTDRAGNTGTATGALNVAFDPGSSGQAIDGYIANALVFRDADGDGVWDHESFTDSNNNGRRDAGEAFVDSNGDGQFTAEFSTTTDAQGNFSNLFGTGRIVLTPLIAGNGANLSTDISTGLTYDGMLTAPDGSTVVTPLTTLVEAIAGSGASATQIAAAQAQVKTALGLSNSVDLTAFDPIAVASTSSDAGALANAVAVQKAAIQVANILTVLGTASEAAGATGGKDAGSAAAVTAIATQISAGGSVDLSSSTVIQTIVQSVATASGGSAASAIAAQTNGLSASLASVNTAVTQATGDSPLNTFAAIVTTQIVAQETLAGDINSAIAAGTPLDSSSYQGSGLASKIDDAATKVEVIVPSAPPAPNALGAPDRPTVDDGARISAAEASDGAVVTVSYGAATGVAAGDRLQVKIGDTVVKSVILASGDIPATGSSATLAVTLSTADLGADGAKSITAGFVSAAGLAGAQSLPAIVTLDTAAPTAPSALKLAAADDSGLSNTDGVTAQTSGLTISGNAEVNAIVTLRDGATILGTAAADATGVFALDISLAAGAHSLTAIATDAAGNVSAASTALAITVDTTAPVAPSNILPTEGGLLTVTEAANGTIITGSTEVGSRVTFTLTNGANSLIKQADVTGAAFSVSLTNAEVKALGEGTVHYSAVATDAAGNVSPVSIAGQYVYSTQPVGADSGSISNGATPPISDEDGNTVGVTPLKNGGFAVHWVIDDDRDGDGDGIAIQRFDASGAKQGGIVILQNIDDDLAANVTDDAAYDLTALDNGGYVLTYGLSLQETGGAFTFFTGTGTTNLSIIGRPDYFYVGNVPGNATFALVGQGNDGLSKSVTLTAVNGDIEIDGSILDQFAVDNRFTLVITNITPSQTANLFAVIEQDIYYDRDAATHDLISSRTVASNGFAIIAASGHAEAFHVDSLSGSITSARIFINLTVGSVINVTGISGATYNAQLNQVILQNIVPDANGFYRIPEALLNQLEEHDYGAFLQLGGLTANSTLVGTVVSRDPVAFPEGVFVQSFDANGVALGDAGARLDGPTSHLLGEADDSVSVRVSQLSAGGFAASWLVDANRDGDPENIAIQRFAADGSKVGGVVVLQGISQGLLENLDEAGSYDFQALANGGYALAYTLTLEDAVGSASLIGTAANVSIIGRPAYISFSSTPPAGVTFTLQGQGVDGLPKSLVLNLQNGFIEITPAILDQFSVDNRFTLFATGLTGSQQIPVFIGVTQDVHYDRSIPLEDVVSTRTVAANGVGFVAAIGHAEAIRIDSITGTPTAKTLIINVTPGLASSLTLPSGATIQPNGSIAIPNVTADPNGYYRVPESLLTQLEGHDFSTTLVLLGLTPNSTISGTVQVRDFVPNPEGVFVQTFGADGVAHGDASARLDGGPNMFLSDDDDDGGVRVTSLSDGGFAVSWVVDADGNGDGENIAVQHFAANGGKVGTPVVLQGISPDLLENIDELGAYDFQVLENGGYALSYSLALESFGRQLQTSGPAGNLSITGIPVQVVIGNAPAGVTYTLSGTGNDGQPKTITLTPDDGVIEFGPAILDQFLVDNRFQLTVVGLSGPVNGAAPQTAYLDVRTVQDVHYDRSVALEEVASVRTTDANGLGLVFAPGHAESFHVGTFTGTPVNTVISITPSIGSYVDLNGISNAFNQPNGAILINNVTVGSDGDYHIPEQILSQLEGRDYTAVLVLVGLTPNTAITGSVEARDPVPTPNGVFVQTFGPDGVALSEGLHLTGTAGADVLIGDHGDDVLNGGAGHDILTGGVGADLFILETPGGQNLTLADLITDFQSGTDHIKLPNGVAYADLFVAQGNPATNGAAATDSLIVHSGSGDILARLANVDAATITQASFL